MKLETLDARMRRYESAHDHGVLPSVYLAARLDGRGFTRLTKETHAFEKPFDQRFHEHMLATASHLMRTGLGALYAFTQSDEISLLFDRDAVLFDRRLAKLTSVLAGEASAAFTLALGAPAAFDCRIAALPTEELVIDYFRWRQADGTRNALNAHCYWLLRGQGKSAREADNLLLRQPQTFKHDLLFSHGLNFARLPAWQKRGAGLYWVRVEKAGLNPRTGTPTRAMRRETQIETSLPATGAAYDEFLRDRLRTVSKA